MNNNCSGFWYEADGSQGGFIKSIHTKKKEGPAGLLGIQRKISLANLNVPEIDEKKVYECKDFNTHMTKGRKINQLGYDWLNVIKDWIGRRVNKSYKETMIWGQVSKAYHCQSHVGPDTSHVMTESLMTSQS